MKKSAPEKLPAKADINLSAYAKKAETLFVNLAGLIRHFGIERIGFVTLTFAQRVVDYKDASTRFHNIYVSTLKPEGLEFISVPSGKTPGAFISIW